MPKQFQPQSFSYSICAKIGEGLHSEVYKVVKTDKNHNLSQVMALKILKSKVLADIWKNEFERLSKISSNYCVNILGWEWISGRPALALEYIDGASLQDLLNLKSLSVLEINLICTQLYWGLKDLQKFGVAHGDLNPRNILFTLQGDLKFIDFGVQGKDLDVLYTSPKFCAPELFYEKKASYESDLYSLGILRKLLLQNSDLKLKSEDLNIFNTLTSSNPKERVSVFLEKKNIFNNWAYSDKEVKSLCKKILIFSLQKQKAQEKTKKIENLNLFSANDAKKEFNWQIFSKKVFLSQWLSTMMAFIFKKILKPHIYLFLVLSCLVFTPASLRINKSIFFKSNYSRLSIFTSDWKKLFIDEVFIGYTPVNYLTLKPGRHYIKWISDKSNGQSSFFISTDKPLVLKNNFFKM
ncbi:MAG: protein kinase [Bdellovibrionales bacterium]|nr:protein kinase [Bdellovibrionales bacterium]